jgi:hypothetical protein
MLARGPGSGRVNASDGAAQNETGRLISQIFQSDLPIHYSNLFTEQMSHRGIVDAPSGGR